MERKAIAIELKTDRPGDIVATFSRFNIPDHDGDVTLPTAFDEGAPVRLLPAHDWTHYMIGKGVIKSLADVAQLDGSFFLNTSAGRDWYESIKADKAGGNPLQEWSYGFDILDAEPGNFAGQPVRVLKKLKVHEVSPVTLGAGIGTGTVSVKAGSPFATNTAAVATAIAATIEDLKAAIASHSTATDDGAWDGPANEARISADAGASTLRRAFAWMDPDKDPATKAAYRFIHHMVSTDGSVGAANLRACSTGIAVLNGGRGGTTIPADDRSGVYAHLARHLRDGDREPPALREKGLRFRDEADDALAGVMALVDRAEDIHLTRRAKEGRTISAANMERLGSIADELEASAAKLRALLRPADAGKAIAAPADLLAEFQHFQEQAGYYNRLLGVPA